MMDAILVLVALSFGIILTGALIARRSRLPPGPRGLPLVGNIFDMPKQLQWRTFQRWSQEYESDIIYLRTLQTDIVVLNSKQAVHDLLEKRSSIYSGREHLVMMHDLIGWNNQFAFMDYGDTWREHRRWFQQAFRPAEVTQYRPRSSKEARKLIGRLVATPHHFLKHIRTMTGSIILGVAFGLDIQPEDDPYIALAERAMMSISATGNAGTYLVDFVPILRYLPDWLPGTGFKRQAYEWSRDVEQMYSKPFQYVKEALKNGEANTSILASFLSRLDPNEHNAEQEDVYRYVTGTAYVAGADTTVSSLQSFVLAMLLYPEVQKTAQEHIDRVIGINRLPEYEDSESLPYITATMLETLRWQNVTPLAVYHKLMVDDEYKGYHLPAGSLVVGNTWAILHDEERYPNPDDFDPTRYLMPDSSLNPHAPDPTEAAFGFGRRICPGRYLAMESLWTAIACILTTLNVEKVKDVNGQDFEPSQECTSGLISYPVPFKANFVPRSEAARALIESESTRSD